MQIPVLDPLYPHRRDDSEMTARTPALSPSLASRPRRLRFSRETRVGFGEKTTCDLGSFACGDFLPWFRHQRWPRTVAPDDRQRGLRRRCATSSAATGSFQLRFSALRERAGIEVTARRECQPRRHDVEYCPSSARKRCRSRNRCDRASVWPVCLFTEPKPIFIPVDETARDRLPRSAAQRSLCLCRPSLPGWRPIPEDALLMLSTDTERRGEYGAILKDGLRRLGYPRWSKRFWSAARRDLTRFICARTLPRQGSAVISALRVNQGLGVLGYDMPDTHMYCSKRPSSGHRSTAVATAGRHSELAQRQSGRTPIEAYENYTSKITPNGEFVAAMAENRIQAR